MEVSLACKLFREEATDVFVFQFEEDRVGEDQREWLLQSPLHVAAYSGDKDKLLEILEKSERDILWL